MADAPNQTILAVDDNLAGRYAICRTLQQAGFRTLEAGTGAEALQLVRKLPDLVLLDVHLPDITGFDVCYAVKSDPETGVVPVVMHSATYVGSEYRVQALNGGADAYLSHPVAPEELIATVCAMLRIRQAEQQARRMEAELRTIKEELELRVQERTRDLLQASKKLENEVMVRRYTEEKMRKLSARLLRDRDEERRRIARELHDSAGQSISALQMTLGRLRKGLEASQYDRKLMDDASALAEQALTEIRTTSYLLHPPTLDEMGFASAARWFIEGFEQRSGITVKFQMPEFERLPRDVELVLFRVLQESLTNVLRHSKASAAEVVVDGESEHVSLSIRDFGKGMPADRLEEFHRTGSAMGVGITGMRERVAQFHGTLEISSDASGTMVSVRMPRNFNGNASAAQA